MSALLRMLAEMDGDSDKAPDHRATPPDALCITLREIAAAYAAPCPFKAGDIVTPRRNYNIKGAGEPHVVLEVITRPDPNFGAAKSPVETSSHAYGARRDVRIACENGGHIAAFWMESWTLEPYRGPDAGREAA